MRITKDQMLAQGYIFNEEGEGYSEHLKDKWLPSNGMLMSTGHYFHNADHGEYVHFWYYNKNLGRDIELEDLPE